MNAFTWAVVVIVGSRAFVGDAGAAIISSYDIQGATLSGEGSWSHTYSGSIVGNDYFGGSGTLNDGFFSTDHHDNQLFLLSLGPTIELKLSAATKVRSVSVFGGTDPWNALPGTITGWEVTIGGNTAVLTSRGFGPFCETSRRRCHDRVSLLGTGLENMATSTVVLSSFQGGRDGYVNATEIQVNGVVPEPETFALAAVGLGVLTMVRRRRQRN